MQHLSPTEINLLDQLPELIWRSDLDTKTIYFNQRWLEFTGLNLEQLIGDGWMEVVHPEDLPACLAAYLQAFQAHQPFQSEYRLRRYDGKYRWFLNIGKPHFDTKGSFSGYLGSCFDITERNKAQEALYQANEKMQAVIDASPLAIITLDLAGIVQSWNASAERIFGWQEKEVAGQLNPVIPQAKIVEYNRIQTNLKQGFPTVGAELTRQAKDGSPVEIRLFNAALHDRQGNIVGYMAMMEDITRLKQFERKFEVEQCKAEHAMQLAALGALAAGLAHEINQPLNALKIHTDTILYWYKIGKATPKEQLTTKLMKISEQADRINAIVEYMRSILRKKDQAKLAQVNLNLVVEDVLELVQERLAASQIKVRKALAAHLPKVSGQPLQFEQIILNLILNAVEALENIENEVKELGCATYLQDNYVILEISDNASGISESMLSELFSPLYTTKESGLGLGLYIVQTLVTNFNGYVTVENNSIRGATFKLKFPASS